MQTSKDFLHIFLDMGDALLNSGAEIFRVEDTLNRMGYACGAAQMNVFVITFFYRLCNLWINLAVPIPSHG